MSQSNSAGSSTTTPLARALDQNEGVHVTVQDSASELAVINAVLKQELPGSVQKGEIAQALQKADEMEGRIQGAAQDLSEVNQLLEGEINERERLERKLEATQAALHDATTKKAG
jgi:C4-dicarboxylate-specific signal transduction histidine kinase